MSRALVTGASAGLGAEFARQLAARGDDLVLVARDEERLAALAAELAGRHGVRCEVVRADLADPAGVAAVAARLESDVDPVDVLVNNAGFGFTEELLDDPAVHERVLAVMGAAPFTLAMAAARGMRRRGHGRIINVSSLAAWITVGHYSAVKAYMRSWSQALASELRGTGVTVTVLCPGWVRTEFHERAGMRSSGIPGPVWVDAPRCVRECLADADAGRVVSIPTKRWKLAAGILQHAPRPLVAWAGRRGSSVR